MGNSRMSELESSRSYLSRSLPLPPHSLSGTNSISMRRGIDASMTIENSSARLPVLTSDEELNAAHQRTATLLNQYFTRQDQVERSEKLLLEQRISSALGTSALIKPILQQFQQQQQALQLQQQLTSLLSNNTSDDLILELLRQNIPLLSTVQREESASMNQLQQHLQQLQQNDAQNQLRTLPMNNNGSSGAYREFRAINSAQHDSAVLFSNFDALTQARILSGLRDIRQSSANSMVVDQMYRQNMSQLLGGNASLHPFDAARESMPVGNNDRKPCATTSSSANENVKSKVIHRMGRVGKFPLKLHVLLKDLKEQGRTDIAAFLPHGRAFGIFNTTEFAENIMPLHFRMSRYSSFQRQLNLYDFQRITEGPDKGAYHVRPRRPLFNSCHCTCNFLHLLLTSNYPCLLAPYVH